MYLCNRRPEAPLADGLRTAIHLQAREEEEVVEQEQMHGQ
jgi:hypothetical protein